MQFKIEPFKHQLDALEKSRDLNEIALFWDMGVGKSKGAIEIIRQKFYHHKKMLKTLILAPPIVLNNWKREILLHSTIKEQDIVVLQGAGKKRAQDLEKAIMHKEDLTLSVPKIVITNYESLQNKQVKELILEYGFHILVCDESHLLKNYKSLRAKVVAQIADKTSYRIILTGTPILNSEMDIFMQYRILDKGKTFGKNFFQFRASYFVDSNAAWASRPGHFPKFTLRNAMHDVLYNRIYEKALRVRKEECLDLPPLIEESLEITLSKEQKRLYNQMKKEFLTWIESVKGEPKAVVAQLAVTKALRLMQIVSGFVSTEEGDIIEIAENPRLQVTKELIEQLSRDHKIIVWCAFKHNYAMIERICNELNVGYELLTGEMNARRKDEAAQRFNEDGACRVLIANKKSAGVGINLVASSYTINYSRTFSYGDEKQADARNHRKGSEIHERIVKINLIAKDTIDNTIGEALERKQNIAEILVDGKGL